MGALLVVVALSTERRAVLAYCSARPTDPIAGCPVMQGKSGPHVFSVLQAGLGCERARTAVLSAAETTRLESVWSVGFAGGLADHLHTGAIVLPASILTLGQSTPSALDPRAQALRTPLEQAGLPVESGPLITLDAPVHAPEAKRRLAKETGAVAADMEAAGVAEAAARIGCPCVALKVVLDDCRMLLPSVLSDAVTPGGDLVWRGLVRALGAGSALLTLARANRRASRRLAAALPAAILAWAALTPPGRSSTMRVP